MHSSILKRTRIAAMLFLVILLVFGLTGTLQAAGFQGGVPLQVGDVIACLGSSGSVGGTCRVLRINGITVTLLDQFSDGLLGDTHGVVLNNTLHALVTDSAASGGVVVYSIASVNPLTVPATTIPHAPVNIFTASADNAQAVVVNSAGQIFVGNAGSGGSIVELNPNGTLATSLSVPPKALSTNPLPLTGTCALDTTGLLSMDLSKDGSTLYLTSNGGNIQKLTLSAGTCAPFASFGPGVVLNGIQDVPPSALAAVTPNCNGTACPSRETILVVAKGFFDSNGNGVANASDVNICTNALDGNPVSCALLLDTGGPGLTASPWLAGNQYLTAGVQVLDANLHVQQVATPGTSGTYGATPFHPVWSTTGDPTVDNAVTWQDQGFCGEFCELPSWSANTPYLVDDEIVNADNRIQKVTVAGTSGPTEPIWPNTDNATIMDGLTWTNDGTSVVARYPVTGVDTLQALSLDPLVTDCTLNNCSVSVPLPTVSNFWLGGSGSLNFYEVNFGSGTVTAFNADPTPPAWQANTAYVLGAEIVDTAVHVQMVTKAGTSGTGSPPSFNDGGGTTTDGTGGTAVTWTDQGLLATVSSSIQGLRIYGAEGANQAGLTKLFTGSLSSPSFTASVKFPPQVSPFTVNDVNTWTVTEYPFPGSPLTPPTVSATLYASLIDKASAPANGNNSGATDAGAVGANNQSVGNTPCQPTTTKPGKCIIWKADLLVPSGDYLAETFQSPTGIDNGTDVFVDLHYDVTTTVGTFDPGGRSSGSVHSLHEIATAFPPSGGGSSACSYISPAGACFKNNRTTLPFVFQCTGLTPSQMAGLQNSPGPPLLSMVQSVAATGGGPKPAAATIFLTGTNSKPPYRYDATANDYVFNWSLPKGIPVPFTARACTIDPTNTVQTFCTNFTIKKTCP